MDDDEYRSFADPETHFRLIKSRTPRTVDGFKPNEPTGEVECAECGKRAGAPEYIPHDKGCSQRDVFSEWYAELH